MSLPDNLVTFVQDEAANGGYGNQSDIVGEGLRLLRERRQKAAALLAALRKGHTDTLAGRTKPLTDEACAPPPTAPKLEARSSEDAPEPALHRRDDR